MKIVVDTNRVIASLVRDGPSRKILFNKKFEFFCPDYSLVEIEKHKNEILEKINVSEEEFNILMALVFENIIIIPKEIYEPHFKKASWLINDVGDVSFIALYLSF